MQNRIAAKIKAMLAKAAEGSGATEEEAASALAMAMAMMTKHGMSQSDIADAGEEPVIKGHYMNDGFLKWHLYTAQAASFLYYCKTMQIPGKKKRIAFIGKASNIEAAEMTFLWINNQVESLYKKHLTPGLSQSVRAELRRTFKMACALRVRTRAWEIMQAMANNDALAIEMTGSTALVVKSHIEKEQAATAAFYEGLDLRPAISRPNKEGIGTHMGFRAGDQVQLNRAVKSEQLRIGNR